MIFISLESAWAVEFSAANNFSIAKLFRLRRFYLGWQINRIGHLESKSEREWNRECPQMHGQYPNHTVVNFLLLHRKETVFLWTLLISKSEHLFVFVFSIKNRNERLVQRATFSLLYLLEMISFNIQEAIFIFIELNDELLLIYTLTRHHQGISNQ